MHLKKVLTSKDQDFILDYISDHLQTWNSHKLDLTGVTILENHFIVVALDESKNKRKWLFNRYFTKDNTKIRDGTFYFFDEQIKCLL